ncbi:MAG: peptidoglycan DD-metalloendopeptidase family protein [Thermodesulfobacteriota bacterium]
MRPGFRIRFAAILAAVAFLAVVPAFGQTGGSEEARGLEGAEREEREILAALEELERQAAGLEDRLIELEDQITAAKGELDRRDQEVKELSGRIAAHKSRLSRRLRALYRLRDGGLLQALLLSDSLSDLTRRFRYLTLILKRDEEVLAEYGRETAQIEESRRLLRQEQDRLLSLKAELDGEREKLEATRRKKMTLLMEVHQKKELYQALLRSREESRQRLIKEVIIRPEEEKKAGTAAALEEPPAGERKWPDFQGLKGRLPRPVAGRVLAGFGRNPGPFNTVVTRHGLVFEASAGAPVQTVLEGRVIHTGWVQGYGNIVIIDHGNRYYTLTGGLAGVKPQAGAWVRQGEVLGLAPKGSQKEKKEIYFEIRHRGQALDPGQWLGKDPAPQG